MPGALLDMEPEIGAIRPLEGPVQIEGYGFEVAHQKLELEIDFATQTLTGHTQITILPMLKELSVIRIHARQCCIPAGGVSVNGYEALFNYEDPYEALEIPSQFVWDASHWQQQKNRLIGHLHGPTEKNTSLEIFLPSQVKVEETNPFSEHVDNVFNQQAARNSSTALEAAPLSATPITPKAMVEQSSKYQALTVSISFTTKKFRDGLHFVGVDGGDTRYPHVYTLHSMEPGTASCIFPCVDDPAMRCSWDISIKCSRTLGEALKRRPAHKHGHHHVNPQANGIRTGSSHSADETTLDVVPLADQEMLLEMVVVCSGEQVNENVDLQDSSKKVVFHRLHRIVAPQHISFAIGPFEQVDLSDYREEENDRLGQGQSTPILGYCLPGRTEELENTCLIALPVMDRLLLSFGTFPFPEFKFVFVEDLRQDTEHTASLALCSTRLLYGAHIIDPDYDNMRKIVHAVACQWAGVSMIPSQPQDRWLITGISFFMTNFALMVKFALGTNEVAFRLKQDMDRLVKLDVNRPSLHTIGTILHLGHFEYDFMALKAPLVLSILDKRIIKAQGVSLQRVIWKLIVNSNTNPEIEGILSTEGFRRSIEKTSKYRDTDHFWNNWIYGSGCPRLHCTQKYVKKKTAVEFNCTQIQAREPLLAQFDKTTFWKDAREYSTADFSGAHQQAFKGSMTIRIHGADGTPYDHIIDINREVTKFDINYNTKYKRLKRSRRQKEREMTGNAVDFTSDNADDILLHCMGDKLQTKEEMAEWHLAEWSEENERKMEEEAYEWIRIDADFEWLGSKKITALPAWMYLSQLQQDRDIVAQYESMVYLSESQPHPLPATFLIRTLLDSNYFHGIRTMAVDALPKHSLPNFRLGGMKHLEKAFQEFYCYPESKTPLPNDFSNRRAYFIERAIYRAMSRVRDFDDKCPKEARHFLHDQLRFNDNTSNEYADEFKVAGLLSALTESLIPAKAKENELRFVDEDEDKNEELDKFKDTVLEELDRHRRIDQWDNSYQNILTVTALECTQTLMKEKIIPVDPMEFARYMHDGTADAVRIKAFEALADLGYLKQGSYSSFLLNVLSTDKSPYVRQRLFEVLCLGLATIAFGEHNKPADPPQVVNDGDLIIEQEDTTQTEMKAKRAAEARRSNLVDAIVALKEDMHDDEIFKSALWEAIKSPMITPSEQMDLLNVCFLIVDPAETSVVKLKLPRHWEVKSLGKVCHCAPIIIYC